MLSNLPRPVHVDLVLEWYGDSTCTVLVDSSTATVLEVSATTMCPFRSLTTAALSDSLVDEDSRY